MQMLHYVHHDIKKRTLYSMKEKVCQKSNQEKKHLRENELYRKGIS